MTVCLSTYCQLPPKIIYLFHCDLNRIDSLCGRWCKLGQTEVLNGLSKILERMLLSSSHSLKFTAHHPLKETQRHVMAANSVLLY